MTDAQNTKKCQATVFDMDKSFLCRKATLDGHPWCKRHNEERIKLYLGYKARQKKLEQFDEGRICSNTATIRACTSLEQLREWYDGFKDKLVLYNRCIGARAMHTERFYGNDMDWGHQTFWDRLTEERDDIEELIAYVESRANEIILKDALGWVEERRTLTTKREEAHGACSDDGSSENSDNEASSTGSSSPASESASLFSDTSGTSSASDAPPGVERGVEDPLDRAIFEKRKSLFLGIRARLATFAAPLGSRFYGERLEVIWAIVRSIVILDPSLLMVSTRYGSAWAMLNDPKLDLWALQMIWVALHKLMVETVCGAIEDVMRPADTFAEDEYVVILGGKVFRTVSHVPWPFHAWGHAAAVHACYKCLSEYCNSVESHISLAKYAIIRPDLMRQKRNSRGMFGDSVRRLRYLAMGGFLPLDIHGETTGMKVLSCQARRLEEEDSACAHDSASNASICGVMSLSDPLARNFADACLRDRNFLTITRSGADSQIVSNWEAWTSRTRRSANLKKWDDAKTNKASEDILGEFDRFVVTTPYWDPKGDCLQLYVLDDSGCDVQQFVEKLLVLWTEVHGVDNVEEIVKNCVKTYLDAGELELSATKVYGSGFLRNVENNFGVSYELLWGIKILPSQMRYLVTRQREILPSQRRWLRAQEEDEEDEEYVAEEDEKIMSSMDPVLCCGGEREEDQKLTKCVHSVLWGAEA